MTLVAPRARNHSMCWRRRTDGVMRPLKLTVRGRKDTPPGGLVAILILLCKLQLEMIGIYVKVSAVRNRGQYKG